MGRLCTADKPNPLMPGQSNRQPAPYHPHYFSLLSSLTPKAYCTMLLYSREKRKERERSKRKEVREKERGDK